MTRSEENGRFSMRFGVNAKISLLIVIVSSLTLIGFTLYDSRQAVLEMNAQLNALGERVTNRLSQSLITPAWDMNWQSMRRVVQPEMENQNVACIRYRDASEKRVYVSYGRNPDWSPQEEGICKQDELIWHTQEVKFRGATLGEVSIGITSQFERETIRSRQLNFFLRLLLLEAILVTVLYLSMRMLFIAPVTALSRLAEKMTRTADYNLEAKGGGADEIGLLVQNFNSLIGEVRSREEQLQSQSHVLEKQVAKRTRELTLKASQLEATNVHLQKMDELKTNILSTVSHELRTPLTSILGYSAIVKKLFNKHFSETAENDPNKQRRSDQIVQNLTIIAHEGERLTRLINDFLDLSKIEAGKAVWNDKEVDMIELTRAAVQAIAGQILPDSRVELSIDLPSPPLPGVIDPDRYNQLLLNLLNNALKFTSEGSVTILARVSPEQTFRVCVSDTGSGIAKEDLPNLFEKFHQIPKKDHERKPGTGLGLAICRQIVAHYKGVIWVESEPGRGSRFYFELPLVPETPSLGAVEESSSS